MYCFRLFTWHSLVVHILVLSMIATAIPLPVDSSMTQSESARKRNREKAGLSTAGPPSRNNAVSRYHAGFRSNKACPSGNNDIAKPYHIKNSEAQFDAAPKTDFFLAVIIKNGLEEVVKDGQVIWAKKVMLEADAHWLMAFIPSAKLDSSQNAGYRQVQVWGYQTTKDTASEESISKWERTVNEKKRRYLYGALTTLSNADRVLKIARVSLPDHAHSCLTRDAIEKVNQSRSERLPDVLSIYELLLINKKLLKHVSFDMSKSSEFGMAFDEMVRKKGTGAGGALSKEKDRWEYELYERIWEGKIILDEGLLLRKNQDALEDLWNEVHNPKSVVPSTSSHDPSSSSCQDPPLPPCIWVFEEQDSG
ncbi:hypothetical protein F5880DRAFT_1176009 [Lentinula raphanica]|nr:hypothetical protein F5880DRAFT_1176009 [Lentinula raphanica]